MKNAAPINENRAGWATSVIISHVLMVDADVFSKGIMPGHFPMTMQMGGN